MSRRSVIVALVVAASVFGVVPASADVGVVVVDTSVSPERPTTERNASVGVTVENPVGDEGRFLVRSVTVRNGTGAAADRLNRNRSRAWVPNGGSLERTVSVGFDEPGTYTVQIVVHLLDPDGDVHVVRRETSIDVGRAHPSMALTATPADPGGRTTFELTVANGRDAAVTGVEVDLSAANASLDTARRVVSRIDAGAERTLTFGARDVTTGVQSVTVDLTYSTGDDERRTVTRTLETPVRSRKGRLSLALSADDVGPSGRSDFRVTVANGFQERITGLELQLTASDATVVESRRVAATLPAGNATTFTVPARAVAAGEKRVTATMSFTTPAGERRTVTRQLNTVVDRVRQPGNVTLTGLRVERDGQTLRVRGSASNLGTTDASGVVIRVRDGAHTGPAATKHRYFVGEVPASDYASFEVQAALAAGHNSSATIPLEVSYVVDGTRVTRRVTAAYEPAPEPPEESGGGGLPLTLLGGLAVVGIGAVGGWRVYDGRR